MQKKYFQNVKKEFILKRKFKMKIRDEFLNKKIKEENFNSMNNKENDYNIYNYFENRMNKNINSCLEIMMKNYYQLKNLIFQ